MQRSTRCVYTSPIKALSNQKFRDFSLKFGTSNVGLVTGDLQINVDDSTCLIMTTEILRSMLYRGADLIRDIEYVIFDEVHYINDTERGVVWEEVIIMLGQHVNLIFLSATTPNTVEFSDWIGKTKRKVVHVITTNYRPVPLSHSLWAGNKLHKVLQGNGSFIEKGYKDAAVALLPSSAKDPAKTKSDQKSKPTTGGKELAWQAQGNKQNWMSLVRYLDRELLTPAVVFSFSKKKCEEIARMLSSLDLNTAKERSSVQAFVHQTTARLSQNDAQLPQVLTICEMVQRGIGVRTIQHD
jgi:antiviral helicase SKI2